MPTIIMKIDTGAIEGVDLDFIEAETQAFLHKFDEEYTVYDIELNPYDAFGLDAPILPPLSIKIQEGLRQRPRLRVIK